MGADVEADAQAHGFEDSQHNSYFIGHHSNINDRQESGATTNHGNEHLKRFEILGLAFTAAVTIVGANEHDWWNTAIGLTMLCFLFCVPYTP